MAKRVLIVENEKSLRVLYRMELEAEGYEVVIATDGRKALRTVTQEPIDLVVLDLVLPDGKGMDYLQQFMNVKREVTVVINTAYPMYKMNLNSWVADAFLTKSSDSTELKQAIGELLLTKPVEVPDRPALARGLAQR